MEYIAILEEQLRVMGRVAIASLPSLVIALLVVLVTWVVAKFALRIADRLVGRTSLRVSLKRLVETLVRVAIWIVGLLVAAAIVIPGFTPASMIAGLGIGAVAIGFAFQDIFENFFAGVLIMLREKMQIGDAIEVEGISGKVENITLRETHIRQYSNELTILPNSMIFKNPVKILTDAGERRNDLVVGVSYDTDLETAERVIREAVKSVPGVSESRDVGVYGQSFGASSVDFQIMWWTDTQANDFLGVKSAVVYAIKRALDKADIEIPYPYVTNTFKDAAPVIDNRAEGTEDAK